MSMIPTDDRLVQMIHDAALAGAPCPSRAAMMARLERSEPGVKDSIRRLQRARRLAVESRGPYRRMRVREADAPNGRVVWSAWTGWTAVEGRVGLRDDPQSLARADDAARAVAPRQSIDSLAPPEAATSPSQQRIRTLLAQGYPPRTVIRMAGLRPHEIDLVYA